MIEGRILRHGDRNQHRLRAGRDHLGFRARGRLFVIMRRRL